ncbi:MAG: TfoX/Sxy family protein [Pirellulales bacterium]|nr:TfoX/Sxy family protein [Pirellulales bacterium]
MPARRRPTSSIRAKPPVRSSYDESLARRVRHLLARKPGIAEKRMFGGLAFLVDGNMCVGIWKESLIARLGPEQAAVALRQPDVREFDVTGRPMRGWVMIDAPQLADDVELDDWIGQCLRFVRTLPAK